MKLGGIGWNWDFYDFGKFWIFLILACIHVELGEIGWNWDFDDFGKSWIFLIFA